MEENVDTREPEASRNADGDSQYQQWPQRRMERRGEAWLTQGRYFRRQVKMVFLMRVH
jgi:hypothetical protein